MEWQGWLTLAVVAAMILAMVRELAAPDVVMMAALFTLAAAGVLTPRETFAGFANEAMATVGALLVLSAALRDTGAMEATFGRLFGRSHDERSGLARLTFPVAGLSAFLNNTTIVAMLTPVVIDWAHRHRMSPGRFLIPLSYATILGGVVTLIGTSTNLTVAGLVIQSGLRPIGFFEVSPVGLAVCAVGLVYLLVAAPRLLPARKEPAAELGEQRREYTVAMIVERSSPLADRTVEQAGLRHLPGLFLVEVDRGGQVITPVASDEVIRSADRLVFAGLVETIVDLQRMRGLVPATDQEEPASADPERRLAEAVVSHSSPLVGRSIRDANFRTVYDAAVIAVHRNGERVPGKIGDIVLRPGDTLLLQTSPGFLRAHRNSPDFYLVSELPGTENPRYDRAWVALGVLAALIAVVTTGFLPISIAAFLAAGLLILTRCITAAQARRSVEWSILLVIAAALGIGRALDKTGVAGTAAQLLTQSVGSVGPLATLAIVYVGTVALTEVISHNAAVALVFPIAISAASQLGVDSRPFIMAITVAASCGFATPIGYQTHLIVYGPGGYRFSDFVRIGLPLDVICGVVALAVIPVAFPF
jgi:di/tricarboxylate transporter